MDAPLADLFVHAAPTVTTDAEGADRAKSATEVYDLAVPEPVQNVDRAAIRFVGRGDEEENGR